MGESGAGIRCRAHEREFGGKLVPIEVELSATLRPGMTAAIGTLQKDPGSDAMPGYAVRPGDIRLPRQPLFLTWGGVDTCNVWGYSGQG